MRSTPPTYVHRFFNWFCPQDLREGIEGDLIEQFEEDLEGYGSARARRRFFWNVLRFFRPGIVLRNKFNHRITDIIMFSNYLRIAYRNIVKNKAFSAINIVGLSIGLAACLLIFQFVGFELSYDTFNEKLDRTYRITNDRFQHGKLIQHGTITYPTIGPTMAKDYQEIESYTRLMPAGEMNVRVNDKNFRGDDGHFADEYFLNVFSFPLLAGDRKTALKERNSVVLTSTTAQKYFGLSEANVSDAIGKTFLWGLDQTPYVVKGVCEDIPENSHIQFDVLIAYNTLISGEEQGADNSWTWSDMRHYLVLKPGVDYKTLEAKFPGFSDRYFQGDKVTGSVEKFYLQPLKDAHLYSDYEYDIAKKANGKAVWAMLIVAVFILVIAWINYINLTTSRAIDRAKEVGLRKVMGAFRNQLVRQFLFESFLVSLISFVIAVIFVLALQESFNALIQTKLSIIKILDLLTPGTMAMIIGGLFGAALLSGFYPAFVLSSYQPVAVLKGKFRSSAAGNLLRKGLVVFQFTASAALITGTLIVSKQLTYMNEADLGINIDDILIVDSPELTLWDSTFAGRVESYKNELKQIPGVENAATGEVPGRRLGRAFDIKLPDQSDARYTMAVMNIDHNFVDTYDIKVLGGRGFEIDDHKAKWEDINTTLLNERAARLLGFQTNEEAIGRQVDAGRAQLLTVVGVVSDFHQESLKNPMEPMLFFPVYNPYFASALRIKTSDTQGTLASVEAVYKKFFPGNAFQFSFLKDRYRNQYQDDIRFGQVIVVFTGLAIIVSCLGLIGLSSYTATQHTREIGIRKVMGASVLSIISLLSADFVRLILLASLIALPIAYFSVHNWLQAYSYRITPTWFQFALPVAVVLGIAVFTISLQIMKAARANPADTLKQE